LERGGKEGGQKAKGAKRQSKEIEKVKFTGTTQQQQQKKKEDKERRRNHSHLQAHKHLLTGSSQGRLGAVLLYE